MIALLRLVLVLLAVPLVVVAKESICDAVRVYVVSRLMFLV